MKIVCHDSSWSSRYVSDCASVPGRMEAIMQVLKADGHYGIVSPDPALYAGIERAHACGYIETVKKDSPLYDIFKVVISVHPESLEGFES